MSVLGTPIWGAGTRLLLALWMVLSLGGEPDQAPVGGRIGAGREPGSQRAEGEARLYLP